MRKRAQCALCLKQGAAAKSQNQVKRAFFLYIVVTQSTTVLELLSSKDESLLVGRNAFFVLYLCFDIFDGVRWLHFERNGFTSQCFDEDLNWDWIYRLPT